MTPRLTVSAIKNASPGDIIQDDVVRGLHLRCFGQKRCFYLFYRTRDGARRRPKLGNFPDMTIEAARKAARGVLTQVAQGADPSAQWNAARRAPMVNDLCDRYLEQYAPRKKTEREDARQINVYIRPTLGNHLVMRVTIEDVDRLVRAISEGKVPGQRKPAPIQANRTRALLSKMFNLAETRYRMRPQNSNPVRGSDSNRENPRRRHITRDEFPRFRRALDAVGLQHPHEVAAITTLLFTGARVSEILAARKDQLDGNKLWLKEHKTADHIGEKFVTIPDAALDLMQFDWDESEPLIFEGKPIRYVWKRICEHAEIEGLRLQDLRRSFASVALANGVSLDQLGEMLAHRSTQTTARYAWLLDDKRKDVADLTVRAMETLMEGE